MASTPRALNIFGGQGSGKGTQSKALEAHFDAVHIGMGDILRDVAKEETPLGKRVNEIINIKGELVSDELSTEIAEERLKTLPANRSFVLEGYPRTVVQAENYRKMLERLNRLSPKPVFVFLDVPIAEIKRRIEERQKQERRHDDTPELLENRLKIYTERTRPILDQVRDWADVIEVNGNRPIKAVTAEIVKGIEDASA